MRIVTDDMSREPATVRPDDPLRKAVELVMVRRIRHIPVVDAEGRLAGIVTDRDVKRILPSPLEHVTRETYEAALDQTTVGRIMTKEPYTVQAGTSVQEAVRLMLEHKVGGLPVLEGEHLVGMFTQSDALRGYLDLMSRTHT
jgi:acetoin utilization protein AcuB